MMGQKASKKKSQKTKFPKSVINKNLLLFWVLMVSAVLIRILRFGTLPYGVNQDEAMGAVDAWALSLYGTDRFGVSLPVHFGAWQVSQMSVLLSYLMIPFIKIFGFHTWVIRLPMLLASIGGIALVYLTGKELLDERLGLIAMAFAVINPWHFMQSRWSIDCNLFPHVFLLAFYLLLKGLQKRRYLYLSMVFFGLTFYCYGIAVYSVTPFLAVFAVWGLRKKVFKIKEALISVLIFGAVALPEILVMVINLLHLDTITAGPFTMSRFPESLRGNDILFLNFSFRQLGRNIWFLLKSSFLQLPDYWFNTIPAFGPMYHVSIPLMMLGIYLLTCDLFRDGSKGSLRPVAATKKAISTKQMGKAKGTRRFVPNGTKGNGSGGERLAESARKLALWGFFLTGVWVGVITYEVNVNRINIIFYPLILITAYAVRWLWDRNEKWLIAVEVVFGICGCLFIVSYFTVYPDKVAQYYNSEFLEAAQQLDEQETESLYITGNMGWQFNLSMAEILTQYACGIDAEYYQGKTDTTGGRELLPYTERYHYINAQYFDWSTCDRNALYLLQERELQLVAQPYDILWRNGQFYALRIR